MKQTLLLAMIVVGSVAVWRLGSRLSADAVGLALGVLLGVLASIPASLLILVSSRRREASDDEAHWTEPPQEHMPLYQPPVIVLAGPGAPLPAQQLPMPTHPTAPPIHGWSGTTGARQFKIVGEEEHWLG
ncbi:MAG TPA: hypothetical protein DCL15_23730 [Chloroflexi bacterium]|nr:hypothetical protein [Chloroflexota bacterium]HHW87917.1 hypothetical protein [Chloroflexota bacterium]